MKKIDINCDMGESIGSRIIGNDEAIMPYITSANIACGFHGGDPHVIRKTLQLAYKFDVAVGAHPSFHDIEGFGRKEMSLSASEIYNIVSYQIAALKGMVEMDGRKLHHVKPHGALYNMAATTKEIADAIVNAIYLIDPDIILYGLSGSKLIESGKSRGLITCAEVFADRTYQTDGTLTPRKLEGAVIHDVNDALTQVLEIVLHGKVKTLQGMMISLDAETVCIHGDHPGADMFAKKIRTALEDSDIIIKAK